MLGEFEYIVITAASALGDQAYGAAIREHIQATTRRTCSIGALYSTIDRLEAKGLIKTWLGESTSERGGRAKRMVRITPVGIQTAKEFYEAMMRISRDASWASQKPRGAQ
jgi:PadR family transcriptional regulator